MLAPAYRVATRKIESALTNLEHAKHVLQCGDFTCVFCKGDIVHASSSLGISPLLEYLDAGTDLKGFSAADKIVGKAAAMLFVLAGVKEAHGCVMSEDAVKVFQKHGVAYSFDELSPNIRNRAGTDICPMEKAVREIEVPAAAREAIKQTLEHLKKRAGPMAGTTPTALTS
jgi:hypothetical protein